MSLVVGRRIQEGRVLVFLFVNAFDNLIKAWGEVTVESYIMTEGDMKTVYST